MKIYTTTFCEEYINFLNIILLQAVLGYKWSLFWKLYMAPAIRRVKILYKKHNSFHNFTTYHYLSYVWATLDRCSISLDSTFNYLGVNFSWIILNSRNKKLGSALYCCMMEAYQQKERVGNSRLLDRKLGMQASQGCPLPGCLTGLHQGDWPVSAVKQAKPGNKLMLPTNHLTNPSPATWTFFTVNKKGNYILRRKEIMSSS